MHDNEARKAMNEHPEEHYEEGTSVPSGFMVEVPEGTPLPDITLTALYGACEFIAGNCPSQDGADPEKLMEHFLGLAEEAAHRFLAGDETVAMAQHNVPEVYELVEGDTNDS